MNNWECISQVQVSEDSEWCQKVSPDPSNFWPKYCCEVEAEAEGDKVDSDTDSMGDPKLHASLLPLVSPFLLLPQVVHEVGTLAEYIEAVKGVEA